MFRVLQTMRNYIFIFVCVIFSRITELYGVEKITYISVERPYLVFYPKHLNYANLTARRFGRNNPIYYVDFNYDSKIPFDNDVKVDFYFYQFLTNQYKPSFVEFHFRFCDLIHKDPIFGAALKQGKLDAPCPYPPGVYNMSNMTILPEAIPRGFPFTKGRIYANMTHAPTKDLLGFGHIDMEIRQLKVNQRTKNKKL